jgi:phage terminase large subunit-like protein
LVRVQPGESESPRKARAFVVQKEDAGLGFYRSFYRAGHLQRPACSRFHSAVLEGELSHDGDPVLARHVGHCVAKPTASGTIVTKSHPDSPRKIDAAVAAIVAFERAAYHASVRGGEWAFV